MKSIFRILACLCPVAALTLGSCGGSDDPDVPAPDAKAVVSVGEPVLSNVGTESMQAYSDVKVVSGQVVEAYFCYSTIENPTLKDSYVAAEVKNGGMTASITGLRQGVMYHVRGVVKAKGDATAPASEFYSREAIATTTVKSITPDEVLAYRGPKHPDHYVSVAGWNDRDKWNLANVHDPTVMRAADGWYYMYQTDASYGNAHDGHGHFHGRRSQDLVNWEYLGSTMDQCPAWVKEKLNEFRTACGLAPIDNPNYGYWAPCVRAIGGGKYRMYYSIVVTDQITAGCDWGERAFIGLMETTDPASNKWEDKGYVVCSSSDRGLNWNGKGWENAYFRYNAIDPTYIVTPSGEHWLIYGSWHSGFAALQLDPATGKPQAELPNPWGTLTDIAPYGSRVATRLASSRWQGSEGPEVVYRDGYYYMFIAYDALDVPYNTRVVRSKNPNGPYVGIDGTDVTTYGGDAYPIVTHPYKFNDNPGWVGISHCAVFDDGQGNWYYASQGRLPKDAYNNAYANAIMLGHVRSIRWTSDGWPLVMPERYGDVPQITITEAELVGSWEHIDLAYKYAEQRTSQLMTLTADHIVASGPWKDAKWSFDEAAQILTINGLQLYVQRECNWEASDRRATIVYAGLSADGRHTYWGKHN